MIDMVSEERREYMRKYMAARRAAAAGQAQDIETPVASPRVNQVNKVNSKQPDFFFNNENRVYFWVTPAEFKKLPAWLKARMIPQ